MLDETDHRKAATAQSADAQHGDQTEPWLDNIRFSRRQATSQSEATSTTTAEVDKFFSDDFNTLDASRKIQRILYRKRMRDIRQWNAVRKYLHIMFYEPSSRRARTYLVVSTLIVLLFLIVFMIDTMPAYRVKSRWPYIAAWVNLGTAAFFAVEWLLRFYAFKNPKRYLLQPLTLIDLLGVIPAFISFTPRENSTFGSVKWLRALQVLRVLRVLRIAQYSVDLYVTIRTIRKSMHQIALVMLVVIIILLTACFLLFFAENDSLDTDGVQWMRKAHGVPEVSPFQNIFFCLYWGFVTVTTVGYGDYTPVSPWGQAIASVTMVLGVFTIVFPTSIISANFSSEWEAFHRAQDIHRDNVLKRDVERRKLELAKVWRDANVEYDEVALFPATNKDEAARDDRLSTTNTVNFDADGTASDEEDRIDDLPLSTHDRLAPFQYERALELARRVEDELGIPKADMGDTDSGVNNSLVVNAMYSKLYTSAYGSLCEKMLVRLADAYSIDSIDGLVALLKAPPRHGQSARASSPAKASAFTVLEYKLLCFVYEKLSLKTGLVPMPSQGSPADEDTGVAYSDDDAVVPSTDATTDSSDAPQSAAVRGRRSPDERLAALSTPNVPPQSKIDSYVLGTQQRPTKSRGALRKMMRFKKPAKSSLPLYMQRLKTIPTAASAVNLPQWSVHSDQPAQLESSPASVADLRALGRSRSHGDSGDPVVRRDPRVRPTRLRKNTSSVFFEAE